MMLLLHWFLTSRRKFTNSGLLGSLVRRYSIQSPLQVHVFRSEVSIKTLQYDFALPTLIEKVQ